ncbi:HAD family hydrolase [Chloroflexota bacterium]
MRKESKELATNVGLIWDIDGVVVDSPHEDAWRITGMKEPWNIGELSSDFYFHHVASRPRYAGGHNILKMKGVYERLGAVTEEERKALLEKFCTQKNALIKDLIKAGKYKLFADAVTLLLKAKHMGIKQSAASASKNACDMLTRVSRARVIEEIGDDFGVLNEDDTLFSLFELNACGLDISSKSGIIKFAAEHLNALSNWNMKTFVVFEDAPSGIKAAKSLEYYAVGILRIGTEDDLFRAGADWVVRDLRTIKIEELLKRAT